MERARQRSCRPNSCVERLSRWCSSLLLVQKASGLGRPRYVIAIEPSTIANVGCSAPRRHTELVAFTGEQEEVAVGIAHDEGSRTPGLAPERLNKLDAVNDCSAIVQETTT